MILSIVLPVLLPLTTLAVGDSATLQKDGLSLAAQGKFDAALPLLRAALDGHQNGANTHAQTQQAKLWANIGVVWMRKAGDEAEPQPAPRVPLGLREVALGEAREAFRQSLALRPGHAKTEKNLQLATGLAMEAHSSWKALAEDTCSDSTSSGAALACSKVLSQICDVAEAAEGRDIERKDRWTLSSYLSSTSSGGTIAVMESNVSQARREKRGFVMAAAFYALVHEIAPEFACPFDGGYAHRVWFRLGRSLFKAGHYRRSERIFKSAFTRNPRFYGPAGADGRRMGLKYEMATFMLREKKKNSKAASSNEQDQKNENVDDARGPLFYDYVRREFGPGITFHHCRKAHLRETLALANFGNSNKKGGKLIPTVMEFGVRRGESLIVLAKTLEAQLRSRAASFSSMTRIAANDAGAAQTPVKMPPILGFDSFVGLPEKWFISPDVVYEAGAFSAEGKLPSWDGMPESVQFIKGWYNESLPKFLGSNPSLFPALLHLDADLYSSTRDVLVPLLDRGLIREGTVIRFDEYWNYRGGTPDRAHEAKAWREAVEAYGISFAPKFWYDQALTIVVTGVRGKRRSEL